MPSSRLSDQQHQAALQKAIDFRQQVTAIAHAKGKDAFFSELFRIAADLIEKDANAFCDRAAEVFEEIEAFGQEPQLDDDWLYEITGENDNFYFSTDSLVTELPPLPGRKRGRQPTPPQEKAVVDAVQQAVQQAEDALSVAHLENPSDWIDRIHKAISLSGGRASFGALRSATGLSPGALFLGLLLGQEQWSLHQAQFYGQVVVSGR